MAKEKQKRVKDAKRGVQKIKLWTLLLTGVLMFIGGIRLGAALPKLFSYINGKWPMFLEKVQQIFHPLAETTAGFEIKDWIICGVMLIVGLGIFIAMFPYLSKKDQSFKNFTMDDMLALPTKREIRRFFYFLIAIISIWFGYSSSKQEIRIFLILLILLAIFSIKDIISILREIFDKRNSEDYLYFEQNKKKVLTLTTIIGAVVIGELFLFPYFFDITLPKVFSLNDMTEYYAAILSLTFISISVMGVLSDKTVVIYWENVAESKLIKPVFFSFAAYTFYSVGAAICSGICLLLGASVAFLTFGAINIVTIIALTFTMVDVYYDREGKKAKLTKELQEDAEDYFWDYEDKHISDKNNEEKEAHYTNKETGKGYTNQEIKDKQVGSNRYKEKMMLLRQNIRCAKDGHNLTYLQEVYDLYRKNIYYFNTLEGVRIAKMLFTDCTDENWPLVIKCITESVEERVEKQERTEDLFKEGFNSKNAKWNQDEEMWIALSRTPYLYQLLQPTDKENIDSVEFNEVMLPIVKRLVALYNDMATHINLKGKEKVEYLQATNDYGFIKVITEQGKEPITNQIYEVFSKMFDIMVPIECITTHMMRMICAILKNSRDYERDAIEGIFRYFPIPNWYTPYLDYITEDKCAKAIWEDYFPELES